MMDNRNFFDVMAKRAPRMTFVVDTKTGELLPCLYSGGALIDGIELATPLDVKAAIIQAVARDGDAITRCEKNCISAERVKSKPSLEFHKAQEAKVDAKRVREGRRRQRIA